MQHNCSNCGNPTRSHELCGDYFCHDCVVADGGPDATIGLADVPTFLEDAAVFNFALTANGDKKPVAPYANGHLYNASWKRDADEVRTDIETVLKYANLGRSDFYRFGTPDGVRVKKLGVGYPIPPANEIDPAESPTLIDFDDARDPDTGALHPVAIEVIHNADSYAQISSSGTGVHVIVTGALPDEYTAIDAALEPTESFPNPNVEVYQQDRYIAMTFDKVDGVPETLADGTDLLEELAEEYGDTSSTKNSQPDTIDYEPDLPEDHYTELEETTNPDEVYDAIAHANNRDPTSIINSEPTEDRGGGQLSFDPSWVESESGTRLGYDDGGFIYRKGDVGLDILQVVALEDEIITSVGEYPSGEDFIEAVEALRQRGANIPEYTGSEQAVNHATFLPEIGDDEFKTGITRDDLHRLTEDQINNVMQYEREVCVDSIMSGGKTYSSFKAAYERNEDMAYFAPRVDLYDQAEDIALEVGFSEDEIFIAPSMGRDCPTYRGENEEKWDGTNWRQIMEKQYAAKAMPKSIHEHHDDIVCSPSGEDGHKCPYELAWDAYDPDQHKVVIGHFTHAHLPNLTTGRHLVFDEQTGSAFNVNLSGDDLIEAVNAFLSMDGSPPADTFTDLLQARNNPREKDRIEGWFDNYDLDPDTENALNHYDEGFNAYAPHAVLAIIRGSQVADGSAFYRAYDKEGDYAMLFFATDDQHGEYEVAIRETPNLSHGKSIIALDGTPLALEDSKYPSDVPEKSAELGVTLEYEKILTDEERAEYVEHTLNHRYIQTSQAIKPYSSGKYNDPFEDQTVLHGTTEQYGDGQPPVVVAAKKVADKYRVKGFVEDGVAKEIAHTGSLRGTNDYADTRLAALLGSSHHGDHAIAKRAAWLGEGIDPSGRGRNRDYGSELANKILEQMREQTTLQNILRFGRDGGGATIILHTAAFPDWLPIYGEGEVAPWSDGLREVVAALNDLFISSGTSLTVNEIHAHDAVSVSKETVRSSLKQLKDVHGLVSSRDDPDDGRRQLWMDEGVTDLEEPEQAEVDLPDMDDETLDSMGLLADDGTPKVSKAQITRYRSNTSNSGKSESGSGQTGSDAGTRGAGGGSGGDSGVSGERSGS